MMSKLLCWLGFHDLRDDCLPAGRLIEVQRYNWLRKWIPSAAPDILSKERVLPFWGLNLAGQDTWYCHRCKKHFYERSL